MVVLQNSAVSSWFTGPEGQPWPSTHSVTMGDGVEQVPSLLLSHPHSLSSLALIPLLLFLSLCFCALPVSQPFFFLITHWAPIIILNQPIKEQLKPTSRKVNSDKTWNNYTRGHSHSFCVAFYLHAWMCAHDPFISLVSPAVLSLVGNVTEMCVIKGLQASLHWQ